MVRAFADTDITSPGAGGHAVPSAEIVHLTAEYWPWARTGGLAEAVNGLAHSLQAHGVHTSVVLPLYREVRESGAELEPMGRPFGVHVGNREETARVYRLRDQPAGPCVYCIDNPDYFDRAGIYGDSAGDFADNARRFAFFNAAALAALPRLAPKARVLHVHDWHMALSLVLARIRHGGDAYYDQLATVLSVHNGAFQGHFPFETLADLGLPDSLYDPRWLEWYGRVNWLKGGMVFADAVTTVSPTHSAELCTESGGFGLHGSFQALGTRLVGIINGIDTERWDPESDELIPSPYSARALEGKTKCKLNLQEVYGLAEDHRTPLVAMSARLVSQKGVPIILESLGRLAEDAQFIFLGHGEARFEVALAGAARAAPGRIAADSDFNDQSEHRLLAGADLLLMPSLYEPCGLTQMRALRYGTIPVARRVGGLSDTIEDGVTGFLFEEYSAAALQRAVRRALRGYANRFAWQIMVREAMTRDFGWPRSTSRYLDVYASAAHARTERRSYGSRQRHHDHAPRRRGARPVLA
jgi:starch synthase